MNRKQRTKDELFVLCLHAAAEKMGDPQHAVNRYEVGKAAGLQPKAVDTICKLLLQANFIKKAGEIDIYLTKHGEGLVHRLLAEKSL